ncbi:MAG: HAD-IA family hydrolase [Prochloron sp. SP5CPC1]|nr:HAD-IA family hydrolase [Candidatus Paraprochloron terpiosi SP5CPC1]
MGLTDTFDIVASAEVEEFGKPHPAVYLTAARGLGIQPSHCVALEDSLRGVMSAKAARMRCIAVPEPEQQQDSRFEIANVTLPSLKSITRPWLEEFLAN